MTKTYTSDNAGTGNIDNDLTKAMNKSENINIQYVKNYLRTQSYGALMVTGNWGCGKTHFFKNELRAALKATDEKKKSCPLRKRCFRKKEYDNGYTLVMVSLFGLHDLHNLPELIFYEFLNAKTDKKILGSLSKKLKDLLKALPTKYVDLTSLAGEGKGLYYIMKNSKVVICLDDLERVDRDKISLREILGVVNNLIENFGFKVIVIANEEHLLDSKNQDEKDFMEKAIEKTVAFVPDTVKAFKEIARIIADKHDSTNVNEAKQESYESSKSNFIKFISRPEIIRTIDPNSEHALMYPDYKKKTQNLRMLTSALQHFYPIYKHYVGLNKNEGQNIPRKEDEIKLIYYWSFIMAISIEYKARMIYSEEDLSGYFPIAEQLSADPKSENYARAFYENYFKWQGLHPIFHSELYGYITCGRKIDFDKLDNNMTSELNNFEPKEDGAAKLYFQFIDGIWNYFNNASMGQKLEELYQYVKTGKLNNFIYYVNAYDQLTFYKDILDHTDDEIASAVKDGINIYSNMVRPETLEAMWPRLNVNLQYAKKQLPEKDKWILSYIMNIINEIKEEQYKADVARLEQLFTEDISAFTNEFMSKHGETPKYITTPILCNISEECITAKVQKLEPKDVMDLTAFVNERYGHNFSDLQEEIIFLKRLEKALVELNPGKKQASDIYIEKELLPEIRKHTSDNTN